MHIDFVGDIYSKVRKTLNMNEILIKDFDDLEDLIENYICH